MLFTHVVHPDFAGRLLPVGAWSGRDYQRGLPGDQVGLPGQVTR